MAADRGRRRKSAKPKASEVESKAQCSGPQASHLGDLVPLSVVEEEVSQMLAEMQHNRHKSLEALPPSDEEQDSDEEQAPGVRYVISQVLLFQNRLTLKQEHHRSGGRQRRRRG